MPRMSRARSISWRRISVMFSSTSGRSIFGLRMEPRSPPVQVATCTSTPSATYLAVEAAPLLDSSSGWAWTCISRSPARGRAVTCDSVRARALRPSCQAWRGSAQDTLQERYGAPAPWGRRAVITVAVMLAALFLGWLVWAIYEHANPKVTSELESFSVGDEHSVTAVVVVTLESADV